MYLYKVSWQALRAPVDLIIEYKIAAQDVIEHSLEIDISGCRDCHTCDRAASPLDRFTMYFQR